ncbi:hypothetical protein MFLO_07187 [Listeria floridensis FSL S10-1187]|uniref:Uncharacterized protein n=1 Tax=Listeria floridensis FSL S10-1187 TaxID=1265817 RepID=A0ABN0RFX2_9LIST|nr:hypothetical protein [Listeria floridensis]EUJ32308.1 hypothetical protein MFLO_07187 [Listeria floridensis FSL S10-1187]
MIFTKMQRRKKMWKRLNQLEQAPSPKKREALLQELAYYEALGDWCKGFPLTVEQKLVLFTKEEYIRLRKKTFRYLDNTRTRRFS